MKVLSLFSGIGAFEEGLKNLNIKHEIVSYCEIEDFASKSYSIIHNVPEDKNLGDISKIDETKIKDFDFMTYGFPCQDLSQANLEGKGLKGLKSGLLYEALRIIQHKKPKYAIAENVKNLIGEKNIDDFKDYIKTLNELGYISFYPSKALNTLDHGLPQNRERIFVISIRKDLDQTFIFPKTRKEKPRFRDLLELGQSLNYDYYLTEQNIKSYIFKPGDFGERLNIKNPYKDHAACLTTKSAKAVITNNYILDIHGIRGLTERECFKLQGFNPDYVDLLKDHGISKNQLYYMIGNSISVTVIEDILRNLLIDKTNQGQMNLFKVM